MGILDKNTWLHVPSNRNCGKMPLELYWRKECWPPEVAHNSGAVRYGEGGQPPFPLLNVQPRHVCRDPWWMISSRICSSRAVIIRTVVHLVIGILLPHVCIVWYSTSSFNFPIYSSFISYSLMWSCFVVSSQEGCAYCNDGHRDALFPALCP